jgi:hypothetical protein
MLVSSRILSIREINMRSKVLIALALFGDNRATAADSDVDKPAPLQPCRPSLGPVAMSVSRADTSGPTRIGFLFDISKEDMPGGYVSYNQRADLVVFGAEGDINAMWNNGLFAVPRCRS